MLTDKQKNIVLLIRRSTPGDGGWYSVSNAVWPLLDCMPDELIDRRKNDTGGGTVRLTSKDETVAEYLV
jgi:hypothetical protein